MPFVHGPGTNHIGITRVETVTGPADLHLPGTTERVPV